MKRNNSDHVVTRANGDGSCTLVCQHCHDSYKPAMPIPVYIFLAITKAFVSKHKGCPAPVVAPAGQEQK